MKKNKILFVLPSFNRSGGESVVKNLVESFPNGKHLVEVLCLTDEITAPLPRGNHPFHVGYGLPITIKNNQPIIRFSKLFKTISLIKKINPNIIHYHLVEAFASIIIPIVKIFCDNKNVVTIHSRKDYYYKGGFRNFIVRNSEKWAFSLSHSEVVAVSDIEYKFLKGVFDPSKLHHINNGINTKVFSVEMVTECRKENFGFSDDDFLIVMVGRLRKIKNQELAIKALAPLVKDFPNIRLLIMGKRGDEEENYKRLVKELKLMENVVFLGELDDVRPILKISDMGLFISKWEGLSIGLLEMMSMRLPVILSDIPEFRNLFKEQNRIPFVNPDDPKELSQEIIRMYSDRKRRSELGQYLKTYVQNEFSIEKQVERHIQLYERLDRK